MGFNKKSTAQLPRDGRQFSVRQHKEDIIWGVARNGSRGSQLEGIVEMFLSIHHRA